jgi:hypothetical protein
MSESENERKKQIQQRFFHRGLVRGYEAALTDIAGARDGGGWEAVQEWLQNHPHEYPHPPSSPPKSHHHRPGLWA